MSSPVAHHAPSKKSSVDYVGTQEIPSSLKDDFDAQKSPQDGDMLHGLQVVETPQLPRASNKEVQGLIDKYDTYGAAPSTQSIRDQMKIQYSDPPCVFYEYIDEDIDEALFHHDGQFVVRLKDRRLFSNTTAQDYIRNTNKDCSYCKLIGPYIYMIKGDKTLGQFYAWKENQDRWKKVKENVDIVVDYIQCIHKGMSVTLNSRYIVYNETVLDGLTQSIKDALDDSTEFSTQLNIWFEQTYEGKETGYLDATKFQKAIHHTKWICGDPHPSDEELDEIVKQFDAKGTCQITKEEFEPFFRNFYETWYSRLTDPGEKINSTSLQDALGGNSNDQKVVDQSIMVRNDQLIVLDHEDLHKVAQIQVPGLTSFKISKCDKIFTISKVCVSEVWVLSLNNEATKIYTIKIGQDALNVMSQSIWVHESFRCQKVAMYSNFALQADQDEDQSKDENTVNVNSNCAVLFWGGQDKRFDLISLDTLQTIRPIQGNYTTFGLTSSDLLLLDHQKLSIVDTKSPWYCKYNWNLSSPEISRIVSHPKSPRICFIKNKRELQELTYLRCTSAIDLDALQCNSTEHKPIEEIVFLGKYAIARRGTEALHVINIENPEDNKFIARRCTQLYTTKDLVIGLYDEYSYTEYEQNCKTDEYEKYMSNEMFFFDPLQGKEIEIVPLNVHKQQGYSARVKSIISNDYAVVVSYYQRKIDEERPEYHHGVYIFEYRKLQSYTEINNQGIKLDNTDILGNNMKIVYNSYHEKSTKDFDFDGRQLMRGKFLYIKEDSILYSQPELLVTKSYDDQKSLHLYRYEKEQRPQPVMEVYFKGDILLTKHVMQVNFKGDILLTHISEDKRDLYVLIKSPLDNKIEIHNVNLVRLIAQKIGDVSYPITHMSILDEQLIFYDMPSGILKLVPFDSLVDERYIDQVRKVFHNQDLDVEICEELKDTTIYPGRWNLTHLCCYIDRFEQSMIEKLRKWLQLGIKVTWAADDTDALSYLIDRDTQYDLINDMIHQIMNDPILDDMDKTDVDTTRKYAIIEHLRPLQNQLTALNRTKIPNLKLVYDKLWFKTEAKYRNKFGRENNIQIEDEVIQVDDYCEPVDPDPKGMVESKNVQIIDYLVSAIKHGVNLNEKETIDYIESLIDLPFQHEEILTTDTVKVYTKLCWRKVWPYILGLGIFHLLFTVLMSLHIILLVDETDNNYSMANKILLWIFQIIALIYSLVEIVYEYKNFKYLKDFWNRIDLLAHIFTMWYLCSDANDTKCPEIVLAFSNVFIWFRLIGFLRVQRQFRYYIFMIIQILAGMKVFAVILVMFVMAQSFAEMALRRDDKWEVYFMHSYQFMLGGSDENYTHADERILFIYNSIVVPIVMLNLIITIIAEEFVKAQDRIAVADVRESLDMVREVSRFFAYFSDKAKPRYIHWISTQLQRGQKDESDVYEGRLKDITRQIDRVEKGMTSQNVNLAREMADLREQNDVLRQEAKDFQEKIINILSSKHGQNERPREERKEEAKQEQETERLYPKADNQEYT